MKYYDPLLDLGCFQKKDLRQFIKNDKSIESTLYQYQKKGIIKRIRGDYYATMDIAHRMPLCDKFKIAVNLDSSNYIAFHSALEYYGIQTQVFQTLNCCSDKRIREFEFYHVNYQFAKSKCFLQIEKSYDGVPVTSIERTIVDCIENIDLAGGIEEVCRALDTLKYIEDKKVLEILDFYNKKVLYQRCGFLLSKFKEGLGIKDETLIYIHSKIGKSSCYLLSSKKQGKTRRDSTWGINVPDNFEFIINNEGESYEI